jgi:penicillin-binding protein 1B
MAGAYTIFANQGVYVKPNFVSMVRAQNGKDHFHQQNRRAHRARSAGGLPDDQPDGGSDAQRHGGGRARAGLWRARGRQNRHLARRLVCGLHFRLALHRVGGFDDNRQLDLEGAHSALPIWTEFMKRALQYRAYRNARPFVAPDGIVSVEIDPESGMLATPYCPTTITEVYISGTQPVTSCPLHGRGQSVTHVAGWEAPNAAPEPAPHVDAPPPNLSARHSPTGLPSAPADAPAQTAQKTEKPKEKKSLLRRLVDVFK